jgi:hypothetical protein
VVVLDVPFYPKSDKTEWSGLGNRTVRFGSCRELVLAFVLISTFASGTLSYSAATSSRLFSMLGFALPLAEDLLLGPVLP